MSETGFQANGGGPAGGAFPAGGGLRGGGTPGRKLRTTRTGVVSSDKGDKTIKVECLYMLKHRKYGKHMRRRMTLHAHDEQNEAKPGDRVELMSCRPMSKTKNWRLVRILEKAP